MLRDILRKLPNRTWFYFIYNFDFNLDFKFRGVNLIWNSKYCDVLLVSDVSYLARNSSKVRIRMVFV